MLGNEIGIEVLKGNLGLRRFIQRMPAQADVVRGCHVQHP